MRIGNRVGTTSGNHKKTDAHDSLLQKQGFICCYCGRGITKEISHIEHLKPRYPNTELAL